MSRAQFWGSFAVLIALFLLVEGPLWSHPWDSAALDRAIVTSYAPIPLLVAGCLLASKRFTWASCFLDTLSLTFVKYGTTLALTMGMWAFAPEPAARPAGAHTKTPTIEAPPAPESVIPEDRRGAIRGVVVDADGRAVAGALVHVATGLEELTFAPRPEPVTLVNDGAGIVPRLAITQAGQRIEARASDGKLHTLVAAPEEESSPVFHVPLMKSGATSVAVIREAHASVRLSCSVHPGAEEAATLIVLAHPFYARTDEAGRFTLARVPAGKLTLAARSLEAGAVSSPVALEAHADVELSLRLPGRMPTR